MKKLLFISSFALAFFWGCEKIDPDVPVKDEEVIEGETPDKETVDTLLTDYVLPDILYASMSGDDEDEPQTRTYVDNGVVLWQNGDAVSYFASNIHNARYTYAGEDGLSKVELTKDNEIVGTTGHVMLKSQAVYPYNENITAIYEKEEGIDKINLTYPSTQTYAPGSFGKDANIMVAAGKHNSDAELNFRNACGYLVIKLYGSTKVKSITLSSVSGTDKIAGAAVVVASSDAAPVVTLADDASTAVTLDCSNGGEGVALGADKASATEFWFCLPPVSFTDGIKITVNDIYGNTYIKQTSNTVNIVRNEVQPMAALEFVSNAPAATKLWYTRSDDNKSPLAFYDGKTNPFDATIKANGHYYDEKAGKFVIEFTSPLTTIRKEAFRDTKIATITLPEGITTIEEGAFENSDLREITIPGSMNNIGINVFYNCDELESVTFLPSPTKTPLNIGCLDWGPEWGPFYDSPLTSINLNRELICVWEDGSLFTPGSWDEGLFVNEYYDDVSSVSVTLGPQVQTLSKYMFAKLRIQTLTIPGTVNTIANNVFEGCSSLTELTFEPSLDGTSLSMGFYDATDDDGPFYSCPLTSVNLNREISYTFSNPNSDNEGLFGGKSSLSSITIGEQVRTLSDHMFAGSSITELVIPGTVNTIGNDVFHGCKKLAALTFEPSPSGTQLTMGYDTYDEDENLFQDNNVLTTLNLDREIIYTLGGVDTSSEGLFGGMSTLTSVTLGNQVKTLSNHMFAGSSITELVVPGSVNIIENDAFRDCKSLVSITFKPSPTGTSLTMGYDTVDNNENLFQDNNVLTTLNLDREIVYAMTGVDSSEQGPFGAMPTLTSVTLGDQVKTLHPYMFAGTGITAINLNKVETIGKCAFINTAIPELTFPGYVTTIGNDVFNGCTALTSLTFKPSPSSAALTVGFNTDGADEGLFVDSPLTSVDLDREIVYNFPIGSLDTAAEGLFGNKPTLTNIVLGDQVQTLSPYMFANAGITANQYGEYKLKLNKVTTIGKGAFRNTGITHLQVPSYVTFIDDHAFADCESLIEVAIPYCEDPVTIGFQPGSSQHGPFYQSPLKHIWLAREIVLTDAYASACNEPDEGVFSNEHSSDENLEFQGVEMRANIKTIHPYMFSGLPITSIAIPGNVTEIKDYAFYNCKSLTDLTFADGTSDLTIGFQPSSDQRGPFYQSPLTRVTVNRNLVHSKAYAAACDDDDEGIFSTERNSQNTTVTLGSQVKTIPEFTFSKLPVNSIVIPGTVAAIDNDAFTTCTKLTSVTIEAGDEPLTIGYNTPGNDDGPFIDCPLTTVVVNRDINYTFPTGDLDTPDEGVFGGKSSLVNVTIGDEVRTLLPYMFANSAITGIDLKNVTTIGKGTFEGASKITSLTIPGSVTSIDNFAFKNCSSLAVLNILAGSEDLTIGYQPEETNQRGPFYQSPLSYIKMDRNIRMSTNYADNCDQSDEGIFSNEYYNDDLAWTTRLVIGNNVTTFPKYMFAQTRVQQLHIPESVNNIGLKIIEDNELINAIVFYNTEVRPTLVFNAFGEITTSVGGLVISGPPGNYQYYIFVPRGEGRLYSVYKTYEDVTDFTPWDDLHAIMVDDMPDRNGYAQAHEVDDRHHESRYLDVPGYEWYRQRYYDGVTITPPTE